MKYYITEFKTRISWQFKILESESGWTCGFLSGIPLSS